MGSAFRFGALRSLGGVPKKRFASVTPNPASWSDAEATAVKMGGHLVTINDQEEEQWVARTFLNSSGVGPALYNLLNNPDRLTQDFSFSFFVRILTPGGIPSRGARTRLTNVPPGDST